MAPSFEEFAESNITTPEEGVSNELVKQSFKELQGIIHGLLPKDQFDNTQAILSSLEPEVKEMLVKGTLYGNESPDSYYWLIPNMVIEEPTQVGTIAYFKLIKAQGNEDAQIHTVKITTRPGEALLHKDRYVLTDLVNGTTEGVRTYKKGGSLGQRGLVGTDRNPKLLHNDRTSLNEILVESASTIRKAQREEWFPFRVVTSKQVVDALNGAVKE